MIELSRRAFLGTAAAALLPAQDVAWKLGGFTKILQDLSFEKTADVAAEIGWDCVEIPLRAKGHVLPERVDDDLPRFLEALRAKKIELGVATTDVRAVDDPPHAGKVLRALAKAGVKLYRLGSWKYKEDVAIPRQLEDFRARMKGLSALNQELGLTGMIQNHSGNGYVGAAMWDLHELTRELPNLGIHFDIGHGTVEQGLSWPTAFRLLRERIGAAIVKDFAWKGATPEWRPIGQGNVNPKFFEMLKGAGFRGPITAQYEYPIGASLEERVRALKADHAVLREWRARFG
jgi:sugar phosphate isomerase/epimerase